MKQDRVTGWRPIERIDVVMVRLQHPSLVTASRWVAPTGKEATIVSSRSVRRGSEPLPQTVSCPTVAKDAHVGVGRFIVDPQLCWHDLDGRHLLVSPALGLRLSIRTDHGGFARHLDRLRNRPCLALIESLTGSDGRPGAVASGPTLSGTHAAILTRWPVPVTAAPEPVVAPATHPARLATGPAAFLREDVDDRYDRAERADPTPV